MTSRPSMSGSPRSTMTAAGGRRDGSEERSEDALFAARPQPWPMVRDFQRDALVITGDDDRDRRPGRRVLRRVVEQVDEDLLDEDVVHFPERRIRRHADV